MEVSLLQASPRNSDPFSTDAIRRFGKRSNNFSKTDVMMKSWAARSIAKLLIDGFQPPPENCAEKESLAYPFEL